MVTVKLFDKEKDYNTIAKWWIERDEFPCPVSLLPNIGFIVNDIVAGFLYQTDSEICFIENVISNKNSDLDERRKALDILVEWIVDTAKEMNYKRVIFHSSHPRIKKQSLDNWQFQKCQRSEELFYRSL